MANSYLGYRSQGVDLSTAQIRDIIQKTKIDVATNGLEMSGGGFTNLPEPTEPADAATKEYVDGQTVSSGRTIVSQWVATNFGNPIADLPHLVVWNNYTFLAFLDDNDNTRIVFYDNTLPVGGAPTSFANFDGKSLSGLAPLAFTLGNVRGTDRLFLLLKPLSGIQIWEYTILPFYDPLRAWQLEASLPIPCKGNYVQCFQGNLYFGATIPPQTVGSGPIQTLVEYKVGTGSYTYIRDLPGGTVFNGVRDFVITSSFYIFWVEGEQLYRSTYTVNPPNSGSYFSIASITKTPWMSGELQSAYQYSSFYIASASLKVRDGFVYMTAGNDNGAIYRANINDPDGYFQLYARNVDEVLTFDFDADHVYTVSDNTNAYNYEIGRGYDGSGSFMTNPFTANGDANMKRVINLGNPINDQDAVTKSFLSSAIGTVVSNISPTLTTLTTDVSTLQTGAVVSNGKITDLETDVNTLQTNAVVSDGKITTLQNTTVKNPMLATLNMNGFGATNALSIVGNLANTFELTRVKKIGGVANLALQIALGTNSVLSVTGGNADMGGAEITSLGAPSLPSSAASRQYIDNQYTSLLSTLTNQRIYYNSTQRVVTFHNNLNSGISTQGTLTFERIGNHVRVSIPVFVVRIGTVAIPYIEVLNAFPAWAAAPSSGQVLPCIVNYRGLNAAVMGRVRFADTNIRFYNDLTDSNWSEAKGGNVAEHGTAHPAVYTYLGAPLKTPPSYKGTAVFGSDPAGPGDILWPV